MFYSVLDTLIDEKKKSFVNRNRNSAVATHVGTFEILC